MYFDRVLFSTDCRYFKLQNQTGRDNKIYLSVPFKIYCNVIKVLSVFYSIPMYNLSENIKIQSNVNECYLNVKLYGFFKKVYFNVIKRTVVFINYRKIIKKMNLFI